MGLWDGISLPEEKIKEINISNFLCALSTTNFGTTGQNNKAIDCLNDLVGVGSANGKLEISTDGGLIFGSNVVTHPFGTSQISGIAWSPTVAGLGAGITETGVIGITTNSGATWVNLANAHGGSALAYCVFDGNGILHVCGAGGKYSKSTTSSCTAMTALIDVGFGSIIADCLCVIGVNTIMISGHSNRLNRSVDGGDTWDGLITTGFAALDALWNVQTDNKGTVVVAVYDSSNGNVGKFIVSTDDGLTFGDPISTFFTTGTVRIVRVKYLNGFWLMMGDSGYLGYTTDLVNIPLIRITNHPMSSGIIYGAVWTGTKYVLAGASGRVGLSLSIA